MQHKWILTLRQKCDLEMLAISGFCPIISFLPQNDYDNVLQNMRLADGQLWPMPITLDVNDEFAEKVTVGEGIGLYDTDNTQLASLTITDKWQPDKKLEAQCVFGTTDEKHPAVHYLLNKAGNWYIGGHLQITKLPSHYDFPQYRHSPRTLKQIFQTLGWERIVGFQTRNPLHRAHMELTLRAAQQIDGHVLIHPVVGMTKPGDIDHYTRVRCYQNILQYYPPEKAMLSLLPLAMRMAGPREALWHALIRKNYGCTHFIVGRDHAGPGADSQGKPFYDPYAAQKLVAQYQDEIGITMLPFQEMVYVKNRQQFCPANELNPNEKTETVSGTQLRQFLATGQPIPEWFSFPGVIQTLREAHPPRHKQGFTIFMTGLSGAGKTTLAQALMAKLMGCQNRSITLLDGDVIRRILANELGFSKADRELNIRRIAYVASEITKAGGIVICAAIAPYRAGREEARQMISTQGGFVELYISTSLQECEKRDTKGLYAKARNGELSGFTGVNDPYESPTNPEINLNTEGLPIETCLQKIIDCLMTLGYLQSFQDEQNKSIPSTITDGVSV